MELSSIILTAMIVVLFSILALLIRKNLREFRHSEQFSKNCHQTDHCLFAYEGSSNPGMRFGAISIHEPYTKRDIPFHIRLGMDFKLFNWTGFDYYKFASSGKKDYIIAYMYLGKNPCNFRILPDRELGLTVDIFDEEIFKTPDVVLS